MAELLVLVKGQVLRCQDLLNLRVLLGLLLLPLLVLWCCLDLELDALPCCQDPQVVDEDARVLVQSLDCVVDADALALLVQGALLNSQFPVLNEELNPGRIDRLPVQLQRPCVFPKVVVVVDVQPLALQEVHARFLHVSASVDHLRERSLRVAHRIQDAVDFLDLHSDVNTNFEDWTVEEDVRVLKGLVDVVEEVPFRLTAVLPD